MFILTCLEKCAIITMWLIRNQEGAMPFEKIEIPTPKEAFINEIKGQIIKGKIEIGEKLPTERELSEQTGISKSIVHFALKDLEHMGFIRSVPRKGSYVADFLRNGSFETLNEILKYNDGKLSYKMSVEIVEFRNAVEGYALVKLAADHSDEDIAKLRASVDELRAAAEKDPSISELAELTSKFHYQICELCGNDIIALVMNAFAPIGKVLWENCAMFWGAEGFLEQDEIIIGMIERGEGHEAKKYIEDIFGQFMAAFDNNPQILNRKSKKASS